jgi:hypothetical protein
MRIESGCYGDTIAQNDEMHGMVHWLSSFLTLSNGAAMCLEYSHHLDCNLAVSEDSFLSNHTSQSAIVLVARVNNTL